VRKTFRGEGNEQISKESRKGITKLEGRKVMPNANQTKKPKGRPYPGFIVQTKLKGRVRTARSQGKWERF